LTRILIGEALIALHRPGEALDWLRIDAAPPWRERALAARGLAQARSGDGPGATATAAALRQAFPATVAALRIEGEIALATRAWPQALGRFGALAMLAPRDGHAHAGEGSAWLGLRRPIEAVERFRACRDVAPWLAECALGLGIALREADRAEQALDVLHEAERLDALDPRVPFEIARTLRALARRDEAAGYAARAELARHRLEQKLPLP
jgi:tetratricopeptide (TPR) repeat protein